MSRTGSASRNFAIRGNLVPYPRSVRWFKGQVTFASPPEIEISAAADTKERLSAEQIQTRFQELGNGKRKVIVRLGSLATVEDSDSWLPNGRKRFSRLPSNQGYILKVERRRVTLLGKSPLGTLYGAQTFLQLIAKRNDKLVAPCVEIMDYPAVENRVLAPAMSWYSGYGRVGFASQLWGWEQWKSFVDWCLAHKINGLNVCIYGYYPFQFEEYPESVFKDVEMKTWVREVGGEMTIRYTHPNVQHEFLQELIRYANARGISVLCYFGLNTFNGGYALAHPESRYHSKNPEKYRQFKYNLCPSRDDTRNYLEASVRKLLRLGFNGIVLEESEGSGFCECDRCTRAYWSEEMDSRKALHRADYELFNRLYKVIKEEDPKAVVGVRLWRMGSEMGVDYLRENKKQIPSDTLIFWSNGMDYEKFKGWVEVFGPDRIMGQDAELLGFSALYAGLFYLVPEQYSSYIKYVDPSFEPSYPQSLYNDIRQYVQAAEHGCGGVTGYAFTWNGWEIAPLSLAQFGWNPKAFEARKFIAYGYSHLFGARVGPLVAKAALGLPIVLESRVCEVEVSVTRGDPVSAGLGALTSLQVPTKFGEGRGEILELKEDVRKAGRSLNLIQRALRSNLDLPSRMSLRYLENAAKRTIRICKAGVEYRKALELERKERPSRERIEAHLQSSLEDMVEDHLIVRENSFDLTEEFHERITKAIETIRGRLARWSASGSLPKEHVPKSSPSV